MITKKVLVLGANSSILDEAISALLNLGAQIDGSFREIPEFFANRDRFSDVFTLNLASEESIRKFSTEIQGKEYDFIICAIGKTSGVPIESDSFSNILDVFKSNVIGLLFLLPRLQEILASDGCICLIGSSSADGNSYDVAYSSTKAALRAGAMSYAKRMSFNQSMYVIEPSLIEGSTMYKEMTEKNVQIHREKWNGNLLDLKNLSNAILKLYSFERPQEIVLKLRPIGSE
jgi:NAD(P)-dependent dehydrogenase (short-subunit alcohol dehydrogenase family)